MSIKVKKAGAYADAVGVFHKRAGAYEAVRGVFVKAGGMYGRVDGEGGALPLDTLTAGSAYSVRRLKTSYTGPLLRVRRSSDNTETDIGFGADNWLDTAALLAFVGAGSGFVTRWYDQSGNMRNIAQTTTSRQPRIVNAGVLDTVGGHPTLYFSGAQLLIGDAPFAYAAGASTIFFVSSAAGADSRSFYIEFNTTGNAEYQARTGTTGAQSNLYFRARNDSAAVDIASTLVPGALTSQLKIFSIRDTGLKLSGYVNGAVGNEVSYKRSGVYTMNQTIVGGDKYGAGVTGAVPEMIILPSAISNANFNTLGSSQGAAWGLGFSPVSTPVEALTAINGAAVGGSSFAVNLPGAFDWSYPMFVDRAKQSRGWHTAAWAEMPPENLDAEGALVSLPDGHSSAIFLISSAGSDSYVGAPAWGGRFRVTWTGSATCSAINAGTNIVNLSANSLEFDSDWEGVKWISFSAISGPVKVSIVRTDLLAAHEAGKAIDQVYLDFLPSGGCFRFMDWMGTNNSTVVNWTDYPTAAHQIWRRVPVSVMVELCNIKSADPWFCMPHQCTPDFVNQMANYVFANLNASLKVRIEKSNEVWNTGLFAQGGWLKNQAESVWGVANGYANSAWLHYTGKLLTRDTQLWKSAFGASASRVIGVIAGQAANTSIAREIATASLWQTYEPLEYVNPSSVAKELAIAPYLNWVGGATSQGNEIKAALDTSHAAAVVQFKSMFPPSLAQSKGWIDAHVALAASTGCRLTMYEYNNHFDLQACSSSNLYSSGSPVAGALEVFVESTYSQEMADAQDALRAYWKANAGSLAAFFTANGAFSRYGTWGAATHPGHNSPIWSSLKAWHASNPRWWSQ